MFHLPLREIRQRFTKSEIVILGWRSQEQAAQMRRKFGKMDYDKDPQSAGYQWTEASEPPAGKKRRKEIDGIIPAGLPDRFFNEEGDVDLRQVTGDDAWKYFAALGWKLPIIPRADGR